MCTSNKPDRHLHLHSRTQSGIPIGASCYCAIKASVESRNKSGCPQFDLPQRSVVVGVSLIRKKKKLRKAQNSHVAGTSLLRDIRTNYTEKQGNV